MLHGGLAIGDDLHPSLKFRRVHQPARTVELSRHLGHAAEEQGGGGQQEEEQGLQLWPGGVC